MFSFFLFACSDFSPIYESINFDATAAAAYFAIVKAKNNQPTQAVNPLYRQNAIDSSIEDADEAEKRKPPNERDVRNFLDRCIPPPPVISPPHETDSDTENLDDPVQISHHTLERLNSLYSLYKMRRSTGTTSIGTTDGTDATDEVLFRLSQIDKSPTTRLFRGSSKAMCSFVSV